MQLHCLARTVLTAVVGLTLFLAPHVNASHGRRSDGVRRHHGLGESGYRHADGVRRFHGLGDGSCYGYGYRSYGRYSPYALSYRVVVVDEAAAVRTRPPIRSSLIGRDRAWALLGRGEPRRAQTDFAVLALRQPDDANARAGYALAAAALGRHETAAWAMRRALLTDATAFADLSLDTAPRRVVLQLRSAYARAAAETPDAAFVDALFMVAALSFLLEEDDRAREAIATVRQRDRTDRAARILVRLLHEPRLADHDGKVAVAGP